MPLEIGRKVETEILHDTLSVARHLGEGGQGAVYLVEDGRQRFALKWYNVEQSTSDQRDAIRQLVRIGAPPGPAGNRFVWPMDLVTSVGERQFGYLMPLIDTSRYAELGQVWARLKPAPGLDTLCEIGYQTANSYRALHIRGLCYRDISAGNLMFDPKTGDVLICDNDNVGVNRQSKSQVWGTMEFMAPELVRGDADPSTETDLHSLAVLLFYLWVWHHPMHGEIEYGFRSWDIPAKRRVYGENPVFIFDPDNVNNRLPKDPDYSGAARRWTYCPPSLQALFTRAFTVGLRDPAARVTEGEWQRGFLELKDNVISCPACSARNLWDAGMQSILCWHCKQPIRIPPALKLSHVRGTSWLLLTPDTVLRRRHIEPTAESGNADEIWGVVVQHPSDPTIWGLRNQTRAPWTATYANGEVNEIVPQRAAPIGDGLRLKIDGTTATVVTSI